MATLSRPGQPDRRVALTRRPTSELIAEELRRLDPDEIYASAIQRLRPDPQVLSRAVPRGHGRGALPFEREVP